MTNPPGVPDHGSSGRAPHRKRENREIVRLAVAGIALVLLIAFVLDNSQTVKVGFVFFSTRISLIWVLLIAALLGALVDRLVILIRQRRKKGRSRPPS
jgi:uncharacterized integral membrane protein